MLCAQNTINIRKVKIGSSESSEKGSHELPGDSRFDTVAYACHPSRPHVRSGTLLGFTTLMQYNNSDSTDVFEDVYESYLVEVQSQRPMLFNFNTPRLHYQRTQFLCVVPSPAVPRANLHVFLCVPLVKYVFYCTRNPSFSILQPLLCCLSIRLCSHLLWTN